MSKLPICPVYDASPFVFTYLTGTCVASFCEVMDSLAMSAPLVMEHSSVVQWSEKGLSKSLDKGSPTFQGPWAHSETVVGTSHVCTRSNCTTAHMPCNYRITNTSCNRRIMHTLCGHATATTTSTTQSLSLSFFLSPLSLTHTHTVIPLQPHLLVLCFLLCFVSIQCNRREY